MRRPGPNPYKKEDWTSLTVPKTLRQEVRDLADEEQISYWQIVDKAVKAYAKSRNTIQTKLTT